MKRALAAELNLGNELWLGDGRGISGEYQTFGQLISNILPNIFIAAGLLVFFLILLGGAMIVFNASNPDKQQDGRTIITTAIIGLLVLFGAFWIIQIVQILTGIKILDSGI